MFAVELSGAAIDTMHCLFIHGPTMDGDLPSKSGRDELVTFGLATRHEGYQWLTMAGVKMALANGVDREKEKYQRVQRERASSAREGFPNDFLTFCLVGGVK